MLAVSGRIFIKAQTPLQLEENFKMTLPVIDLSSTFIQSEDNWNAVAEDLLKALRSTGFIYLTGHGIDLDLVQRAFEATKSFFDLPLDKKMKNYRKDLETFIGYLEVKEEKLPWMKHLEYKECFNFSLHHPILPSEPPELGPSITKLTKACFALQDRVYRLLATGLGLQNLDEFLKMFDSDEHHTNQSNGKIVRYPAVPKGREVPEDMVRCGEHKDFGVLTFLFQDDAGGLEAKTTNGEWIPVTPIHGSVVVNVGEILEKWTNGYLKATPHRILMHGKEDASLRRNRHSLVFFSCSHDDAPVAPLATKFLNSGGNTDTSQGDKSIEMGMTTSEFLAWLGKVNASAL